MRAHIVELLKYVQAALLRVRSRWLDQLDVHDQVGRPGWRRIEGEVRPQS
ncbi:MAG: hypothetical protein WAO15_20260 [Mycobacterium sp.]